jgi:hypothetical protein
MNHSNMTSFFRFVDKRAIYRWYNLIRTCAGECDHILASMIYFDSDMSKSTNTVVYFDWKTVIYIYACGKCCTQFMLSMEKSQSHSPAHVLMRLYRMDNSLVC